MAGSFSPVYIPDLWWAMLDSFRNASKTWIVKLFLAILALSFLVWGVEDFSRIRFDDNSAITVGQTKISPAEVRQELKREIERLQPMFGGNLTSEMARTIGLEDEVISSLVTRTLVDESARKLKLGLSDKDVGERLRDSGSFKDPTGRFDPNLLRRSLARIGMSEAQFIAIEKNDIIRQQLAEALSGGAAQAKDQNAVTMPMGLMPPKSLIEAITLHNREQRSFDVVHVADERLPLPAAPDAATLEAFYKNNQNQFMAPEYRNITVLYLSPDDVAGKITITDAMIADAYANRHSEFFTPELRSVQQVVFSNAEKAQGFLDAVKSGKSFAEAAKATGVSVIDLGRVTHDDLPIPLAEPVFALTEKAVSPAIETPLGWHVAYVDTIVPAHEIPLDSVRPRLVTDLKKDEADTHLYELGAAVEDTLAGGATLEEAASRNGNLKIVKIPVTDTKGQTPDGQNAVANLPHNETVLQVAFHTNENEDSTLTNADGQGYFLLHVNQVTPESPKPLEMVQNQVLQAWQGQQRHLEAQKIADQIAADWKEGKPTKELLGKVKAEVQSVGPMTRDGDAGNSDANGELPADVVTSLFAVKDGGTAVGETAKGWVVARLTEVIPFETGQNPQVVVNTGLNLSVVIVNDLIDQYLAAQQQALGVSVNRKVLGVEE